MKDDRSAENAFEPGKKDVLPLDEVTTVSSVVDGEKVHVQPAKMNVPDNRLGPLLKGNRGTVVVKAAGASGAPVVLNPDMARSLAVVLLDAADTADFDDQVALGTVLAQAVFAGGDVGFNQDEVDTEGVKIGDTFGLADHDGDELLLTTLSGGAHQTIVVTAVDVEDDEHTLSVALTRDMAARVAERLLAFAQGGNE